MLVRDGYEAEEMVLLWLQTNGYSDARGTGVGPDGGVDAESRDLVVQVKAHSAPVGRPVVQALYGIAAVKQKKAALFALSGVTAAALEWANEAGVAVFEFDRLGAIRPVNPAGVALTHLTAGTSAVSRFQGRGWTHGHRDAAGRVWGAELRSSGPARVETQDIRHQGRGRLLGAAGDTLVFAVSDGSPGKPINVLVALNALDLSVRWFNRVPLGLGQPKAIRDHLYGTVVDGDLLTIVAGESMGSEPWSPGPNRTITLDTRSGELLRLDQHPESLAPEVTMSDGVVYSGVRPFDSEHFVVEATEALTGATKWRTAIDGGPLNEFAASDAQFVLIDAARFEPHRPGWVCLDARSGNLLWEIRNDPRLRSFSLLSNGMAEFSGPGTSTTWVDCGSGVVIRERSTWPEGVANLSIWGLDQEVMCVEDQTLDPSGGARFEWAAKGVDFLVGAGSGVVVAAWRSGQLELEVLDIRTGERRRRWRAADGRPLDRRGDVRTRILAIGGTILTVTETDTHFQVRSHY